MINRLLLRVVNKAILSTAKIVQIQFPKGGEFFFSLERGGHLAVKAPLRETSFEPLCSPIAALSRGFVAM